MNYKKLSKVLTNVSRKAINDATVSGAAISILSTHQTLRSFRELLVKYACKDTSFAFLDSSSNKFICKILHVGQGWSISVYHTDDVNYSSLPQYEVEVDIDNMDDIMSRITNPYDFVSYTSDYSEECEAYNAAANAIINDIRYRNFSERQEDEPELNLIDDINDSRRSW